ncbi:MAG: carboxyltransferase domain-containing protein [Deltaproteobacteria bacterium]|nr:carboxyltransferase domain-containing protein [Deltaproteobacteria bacterium]
MPHLVPFGSQAFRITLDDAWIDDVGGRIALSAALSEIGGVHDVLVTEVAALIVCGTAPEDAARAALEDATARALERSRGRPLGPTTSRTIDVVYDGEDLDPLSLALSIPREELIARHTASDLVVSFLGFAPGFAYLRGLDPVLSRAVRHATPRRRVAAGSVAIAAGMSAIYPAASPGGWQLLGHAVDFDPLAAPLRAGERVVFRAARTRAHERLAAAIPRDDVEAIVIESASGPSLLVDGTGVRRLADGAPPGGPLVRASARRALTAVAGGPADVILERYGALTIRSRAHRSFHVADERGHAHRLEPGQALSFDAPRDARVGHLAVEGGFVGAPILGGRGTMLSILRGGHEGRPLRRGDRLGLAGATPTVLSGTASTRVEGPLRARRGPDRRDGPTITVACTIAHASDRTGTRLVPRAPHRLETSTARTAPMIAGAIQAPPSGELIVLGPEHPVTGGYPVIGVLDPDALDVLFATPLGREVTLEIE